MPNNSPLNEIGNAIKESLEAQNFDGLNDAISQSVKQALDDAGKSIANSVTHKATSYGSTSTDYINRIQREREAREARERAIRERNRAIHEANLQRARQKYQMDTAGQNQAKAWTAANNQNTAAARPTTALVARNPYGVISPTGLKKGKAVGQVVAGSVVTAMGLTTTVSSIIPVLISGTGFFGMIFGGLVLAGGLTLLSMGTGKLTLMDRARRYAQVAGNKLYADISQISASTGTEAKKVLKHIKKLLNKGYYNQAYLDDDGQTLMLSDSVYSQYLSTKKQMEQQRREKLAKEGEPEVMYSAPGLSEEEGLELTQMMNEGEDAINRLHQLNDEIPGEIISQKLYRSEDLLKEIFSGLKRHPEQMKRMHKLMDYYLPTMMKLVEAYAEYDKVSVPGKEMLDAKSEIERTLDTINEAFEQLLNNLFRDSVWDITTDAQVLQTMLANEGLAKDK